MRRDLKIEAHAQVATNATVKATSQVRKRLHIASVLDDALSDLRAIQKTHDYFTGYSLNEAISERIAVIGSDTSPESYLGGRRTLIAQLLYVKDTALAAIASAKTINEKTPVGVKEDDIKVDVATGN